MKLSNEKSSQSNKKKTILHKSSWTQDEVG